MAAKPSGVKPLLDHPFTGPFLDVSSHIMRSNAVERLVNQLVQTVGWGDPDLDLARSWHAVLQGSEGFDEDTLETLRETEPVLRTRFPEARRALALNLAAQGCHTWFLYAHDQAIPPLQEAFTMMCNEGLVCAADFIKVAEVLASCYAHVEEYDDALHVLAAAYPAFLEALEQHEWLANQYDEFREEFLYAHGHHCSPELLDLADAISGPRVRDMPRACLTNDTHTATPLPHVFAEGQQ